ncbi:MAG: efflux RND transporter periplasmic adaptor subunit [Lentisphaeria bacterium]|nr:efflux RND transporter periplasmic adaptor subunit [Lentisphaeria bacterium]
MNFPKKKMIWLVPAGLVCLIIFCALVLISRAKPPLAVKPLTLANVEVMTVIPREFHETLELPARTVADQAVIISAESGGRLDEWRVDEGASVEKDQVLAVINDAELQALLGEAEARVAAAESHVRVNEVALTQSRTRVKTAKLALAAAESDYAFQRKEYERIDSLWSQDVVPTASVEGALNAFNQSRSRRDQAREAVEASDQDVLSAEAAVELAESQLVQARKSVDLLRVQLAKTRIKAPFTGRVDKRLVDTGALVASGTPVIGLYDMSHARAVVNVGDRYVSFLDPENTAVSRYLALTQPGAEQKITSSIILPGMPKLTGGQYAGMELPAEIARVGQVSDPVSNTFEVELRVANPGAALKQGIIVKARLGFLAYKEALIVPLTSLVVTDSGIRVLVVERDLEEAEADDQPAGERKEAAEKDGDGAVKSAVDRARSRPVIPVSIQGENVLIRGNVKRGERVIIAGGKGVVDGERVNVLVVDGQLVGAADPHGEEE